MTVSVCAQVLTNGDIKALPYEPLDNCSFLILSSDEVKRMSLSKDLNFDIDAAFLPKSRVICCFLSCLGMCSDGSLKGSVEPSLLTWRYTYVEEHT